MFNLIYKTLLSKEDKIFYKEIKKLIGFAPNSLTVFKQAFTHNSYLSKTFENEKLSNERLEFLGDAVLDVAIASLVFKKFPTKGEGFLTEMRSKIVSREQLSNISRKLNLENWILVNPSLKKSPQAMNTIGGNCLEALVGAIYLDGGYKNANLFIFKKIIKPFIDLENLEEQNENYKSLLLNWSQKNKKTIDYRLISEIEQNNQRFFTIGLYIDDNYIAEAKHITKKKAEQMAAFNALQKIENQDDN